jgi:hypothetical protein
MQSRLLGESAFAKLAETTELNAQVIATAQGWLLQLTRGDAVYLVAWDGLNQAKIWSDINEVILFLHDKLHIFMFSITTRSNVEPEPLLADTMAMWCRQWGGYRALSAARAEEAAGF